MNTITATFNNRADAEIAVMELQDIGIPRSDISMLLSDTIHGQDFAHGKHFAIEESNKSSEGVATGGVVGGALGALAAGLIAVGSLTIPGVGLLAAGPIVAALSGGAAGALAGGLVGGLVGMGIPEHEAKLYEKEIEEGAILVAVNTPNDELTERARTILKRNDVKHLAA